MSGKARERLPKFSLSVLVSRAFAREDMQVQPGTAQPHLPRLRLRLRPAAETAVRGGHPWVYDAAIKEQNRSGQPGELAAIYDKSDKFLAIGLFDPTSPIRVRILHTGKPVALDDGWWAARLTEAIARREGILDSTTNACRLIYGESDGWPGLVLDRYDRTLVLKLYAASWRVHANRVANLIQSQLKPERIILRLSRNVMNEGSVVAGRPDLSEGVFRGAPLEGPVVFLESGLFFEAEVLRGQKTGFFLDQRENRREVAALASGQRVLNTFSFSGAFSVYAARGGATSVTDVDISSHALESARKNFELNRNLPSVAGCERAQVKADVFEFLQSPGPLCDVVVLDPPSFARREPERQRAVEAYRRLAALGAARVKPGGILLACSCSAHVSTAEFFGAVQDAARGTKRKFQVMRTTGHPPDHMARFPEAEYLKAIYLRFSE